MIMRQLTQFWRLTLAGAVTAAACGRQTPPAHVVAVQPTAPRISEAEVRDLDIAFYAERVERDPTGATDLVRLGVLYLARSRETGDPRDAILAEAVARRSMRNRARHNEAAAQVLASSLLAQHRFNEALHLATIARDAEPESSTLQAAVGEIQMELGQYDSARVSFSKVHAPLGELVLSPRLARWAEIQGNTEGARRLLHAALATARRQSDMPRAQLAWYWMRVGDVELRAGNMSAADSAYRSGLAVNPDDYRLLSAMSRSMAMQKRWRSAIAFGERAIGVSLDPATLGTLSDAYAALGDSAKSVEYARVLDVVVGKQPGAYHRAWSLWMLDHDRNIPHVARKIREEMRTRQDVYAYDLLAWSLHRQGRDLEADKAMKVALRLGTRDALLEHHSAAIRSALGTQVVDAGSAR